MASASRRCAAGCRWPRRGEAQQVSGAHGARLPGSSLADARRLPSATGGVRARPLAVVRDHDQRHAAARSALPAGASLPRRWRGRGCRSARRRAARPGCMMVARAMATRWRWPPESWSGRWSARSVQAEVLERLLHALGARSAGMPASIIGSAMFSAAVSRGTRWKLWKTKPMRSLRTRACSSGDSVVTSRAFEPVVRRRWAGRAAQQVEQRRFARARRPHHRHVLAGGDARSSPQRMHLAVTELEYALDAVRARSCAVAPAWRCHRPAASSTAARRP